MQLVGPYQLLGVLGDSSFFAGWQQLGADRRGDYIEQNLADRIVLTYLGHPSQKHLDQGFGQRGVQTVHRHLVAIVGRPAQCQFAQVARAEDHAVLHVGDVHQDLCPLPGLGVFVGGRLFFGVESDIGEVLFAGFADGNFAGSDAQAAHQGDRVAVGAVAGAESGHCDADDAFAVEPEAIESPHGDQQGQCGVKPPETPMTTFLQSVCCRRWASPIV